MKYLKIKIAFLSVIIIFFGLATIVKGEDITPPDGVPTPNENITIRDGANIIWQGAVPLPKEGNVDLNDKDGNPHTVNARSVLAVLAEADAISSDFDISDLEYYPSFGSLYMKCMASTTGGDKCDNWQYTVNNSYAFVGMDQNILSGDENIYIYFGTQYRHTLSATTLNTSETLTVNTEEYNYEDDTWKVRSGVTVGLTQPDPSNPWSPTEVLLSPVDASGVATFTSIPVGTYDVGVKEDYYYPTYSLTVNNPPISGGGGGSATPKFNTESAISYLISNQSKDGSFGDASMYTDWAIIALRAGNYALNTNSVMQYLESTNALSGNLTDNERRAMALLSLGENPYDYHGMNYIGAILGKWNGTQFGDANLVNDDIFALIPLSASGYTRNDDVIKNDIEFILSKQKSNGSWEDSVDVTAAAVQALIKFKSVNGVSFALTNANDFLESKQDSTGGFGNISSTSWAMGAMSALGKDWAKNNKSPLDYLASNQEADGAISPVSETLQNRIWATSYAIPGALSKTWNDIMVEVSKPEVNNNTTDDKVPEVKVEVKEEIVIPTLVQKNINPEVKIETNVKKPALKKVIIKDVVIEDTQKNNIGSPLVASVGDMNDSILKSFKNWLISIFTRFINIFS